VIDMSKIPTIMALYNKKFLSSKEVVSWADEQLLNESEPFDYISELSLKGPKRCLALPQYEFPAPREFTYIEEFSLRVYELEKNYDLKIDAFVKWVIGAAMGSNIEVREVHLGYLLDHYFLECDDLKFANEFVKKELAILIPKNKPIAEEIWREIA